MTTQYTPEADREANGAAQSAGEAVKHCSCGATGLVATALAVGVLYPLLLAVTRPFYLLSSTWLVLIVVAFWLSAWMALELAWDWQASRGPTG